DARGVDRLRIAGNERVPPVEITPGGDELVGAGRRQPGDGADILRRQAHAILDLGAAIFIVPAPAGGAVQEAAAHVGEIDIAGVLVLELTQAAAAAAVAEALPFGIRHIFQ